MQDELDFTPDELQELTQAYKTNDYALRKKNDDYSKPTAKVPEIISRPIDSRMPVKVPNVENSKGCKIIAVFVFILCAILLVGIIVYSTLSSYEHAISPRGVHIVRTGHRHTKSAEDDENFLFEFTTEDSIQVYNSYLLTTHLPPFDFADLIGYRICCKSWSHKFICGSGYTFSNGLALDGYLADEAGSVYLYLLVNGDDLAGVPCDLSLLMKE